jgi:ankyrin repeat protein
VRLLLDAQADINEKMANGRSALDEAVRMKHSKIVSLLKQRGAADAPANTKLGDELLQAALKGDLAKTKSLLSQGASVNAKNNKGSSALMQACIDGHSDVATLLLTTGADVNARDWEDGTTALLLACMTERTKLAKILLEAGADVHVQVKGRGWTPLYVAASTGNLELVRLLLDAGAGDNAEFKQGAAIAAVQQGHKEIGRLILDPERQGKPFYQVMLDSAGRVVGIWVADPKHPNLQARIEMLIASEKGMSLEHFAAFKEGRYRTVQNKTDNRGGAFLMFGDAPVSAGKGDTSKKKWWRFW